MFFITSTTDGRNKRIREHNFDYRSNFRSQKIVQSVKSFHFSFETHVTSQQIVIKIFFPRFLKIFLTQSQNLADK